MRLRILGLVWTVCALACVVGCGGGGSSNTPNPPATLTITTTSPLTAGTVGTAYSLTLAATGGTAPYTWSVSAGTLPAGLALSAAGGLTGTPTAAGSSSFTVQVKDSASSPQMATLAATLVINPAKLAITTTSPLMTGTVGTAYSLTLAATGGTTPYTWSVSAGTLPAGLALSTAGVLSGTPTAAGSSSFTIQATDSASSPQMATLAATLVINPPPLAITTTSPLPNGTLGIAYVATFKATGGTSPYQWSVTSGSLPAGLSLTSTGLLSGAPTASGSSSFTVQAVDSASTPQTTSDVFTLQINVGTLSVKTSSLPSANVGSTYSVQLAATGGAPPYTWAVGSGVPLPTGLALSSSGLISGTPGASGTTMPTFTVTDSASNHASATLTLTVNPPTGTIPDGHYSFVFGGTAPQGTSQTPNGVAINGTITLKSGTVMSGFYDENTNTNVALTEQSIVGGSLTIGANGIGQMVITTANTSMTFSLASPASVSTGGKTPIRIIEFDDANGTGSRGSGVLDPADPNPTTSAISGNFAFLFSGTDIDENQQALVCSFQTDGAGKITHGNADANQFGGQLASWSTLSGSYAVDSNGRGTLTILLGGTPFHFSFYEISPAEWLAISLDSATLNSPLVSGRVEQQTGGPFSTTLPAATSVLEISGVAHPSGGTITPDITLGLATSNASGNLTYTFDEYNGSLMIPTPQSFSVTYTVDPTTGRAKGTAAQPILYIIDSTPASGSTPASFTAFLLGPDRSASSGIIEPQSGGPFGNASFNGNYLGGSLPLSLASALNENGLVVADGAGNVTFTTNRSTGTSPFLTLYQNVVGTYAIDSTGRGVITTPDGLTRIFYVVSPTKIAYLTGDTGGYLGNFQQ